MFGIRTHTKRSHRLRRPTPCSKNDLNLSSNSNSNSIQQFSSKTNLKRQNSRRLLSTPGILETKLKTTLLHGLYPEIQTQEDYSSRLVILKTKFKTTLRQGWYPKNETQEDYSSRLVNVKVKLSNSGGLRHSLLWGRGNQKKTYVHKVLS